MYVTGCVSLQGGPEVIDMTQDDDMPDAEQQQQLQQQQQPALMYLTQV